MRKWLAFGLLVLSLASSCGNGRCKEHELEGPLNSCVPIEPVPCQCATEHAIICCRKEDHRGQTDGCIGDPVCSDGILVCPLGSYAHTWECSVWPNSPMM